MYVTAHRVRAEVGPLAGRVDINGFLHLHDAVAPWPGDVRSLVAVADGEPGRLVRSATPIPPGGNTVLSYLELVASDAVAPTELVAFLAQGEAELEHGSIPLVLVERGKLLRFGVSEGLLTQQREEFKALAETVESLLGTSGAGTKPEAPQS